MPRDPMRCCFVLETLPLDRDHLMLLRTMLGTIQSYLRLHGAVSALDSS